MLIRKITYVSLRILIQIVEIPSPARLNFGKPDIHIVRAPLDHLQPPLDALEAAVHDAAQVNVKRDVRPHAQDHGPNCHDFADRHFLAPAFFFTSVFAFFFTACFVADLLSLGLRQCIHASRAVGCS
jgi:hypothetical protein